MSGDSVIRSLCVGIFHRWEPQRLFAHMAMVQLTAYADEAGTHGDSKYTLVAGWVGRAEQWEAFEPKWKSLLFRHRLTHIHLVDLRHGKKQFKGWPTERRLALAQEAGQLAMDHALFGHTVLLKNSDYDAHYIGADRELRKHRAPIDSKYGVCVRIFLSQLAEFVQRYGGEDSQCTVILEAGAANQGAAQVHLADMYRIAPKRARFLSPQIVYALKEQSPGVQAADVLAYRNYVLHCDGAADIQRLEPGFPENLPAEEVENFFTSVTPQILINLKTGQKQLRPLRGRLGRDWGHLDGFPVGWMTKRLRSSDSFLLVPPERPYGGGAPDRETREQCGSVRLRCR